MFIFRNIFFRISTYLFGAVIFLSSCTDPEIIGLDVQPPNDKLNLIYSDSTTITAYTIREDSLRTDETTYQLLGSYLDPVFGRTDASIFAQVTTLLPGVSFGDSTVFDSLVLSLAYSGYYGDTNQQTFRVYQLSEAMSFDSVYYSNKFIGYNPIELGSVTLNPAPNDSVMIDSVERAPHLRININNTHLGDSILAHFGQTQIASPDSFLIHLPGLCIKADSMTATGGIFYFNLLATQSKMTLYYHYSGTSDTLDHHYDFIFHPFRARMSYFKHDYVTTATPVQLQLSDSTNGDSLVYIQSMAGVKAKIRFPHLMDYIKDGMIIINKAEVEITVNSNNPNNLNPPAKLLLLGVDSVGTALFLADQFEGASYYGGDYNTTTRKYKFNIAHHLQNILRGTTKDYGLYLAVSGGSVQANRAVINGFTNGTDRIKLNLFYTKPN